MPEVAAIGDFDNVSVTLRFASGTIGVIDQSRFCNYGYDQRLEVFGKKGMINVENVQPNSTVVTTPRGPNA